MAVKLRELWSDPAFIERIKKKQEAATASYRSAMYFSDDPVTRRQQLSDLARYQGWLSGNKAEDFKRVARIKDWPEVKESQTPESLFMELFEDYKAGYTKGIAERAEVFERARKLGQKDGEAGQKLHMHEIVAWRIVPEMIGEGASHPVLIGQLHEAYNEGYNQVFRGVGSQQAKPAPRAATDVDAGRKERVKERLAEVLDSEDYKVRLALGGRIAEDLKRLMKIVETSIVANDFEKAERGLDFVERIFDKVPIPRP